MAPQVEMERQNRELRRTRTMLGVSQNETHTAQDAAGATVCQAMLIAISAL